MKIISEQLQRYSNTHTAWSGDDRDAVTMLQAFLGSGGKSVRGSRLKTHGFGGYAGPRYLVPGVKYGEARAGARILEVHFPQVSRVARF